MTDAEVLVGLELKIQIHKQQCGIMEVSGLSLCNICNNIKTIHATDDATIEWWSSPLSDSTRS